VDKASLLPPTKGQLLAVFFSSWDRCYHCFVVDPAVDWYVTACLLLRLENKRWTVEPFVFTEFHCPPFSVIPIDAVWLRVLLGLAISRFEPELSKLRKRRPKSGLVPGVSCDCPVQPS